MSIIEITIPSAVQVVEVQTKGTTGAQGPAGPSGPSDHTLLTNIGVNTHAQVDSHIASTANPHSVTKTQVGLGNADNTSDADKPVSTATQTALDLKVDENAAITGATKTKITYDAKGLVTSGTDAAVADITGLVTALAGKADQNLGNLTSPTSINQDLLPSVTATRYLGSSSFRWARNYADSVYASGIYDVSTSALRVSVGNQILWDNTNVAALHWSLRRLYSATVAYNAMLDWSGDHVSLNTHKLTDVVDPTSAQDAATKAYADTKASIAKTSLSISKTGDWIVEPFWNLVPPNNVDYEGAVVEYNGKWIETLTYNEASITTSPRLTTLTFTDLEGLRNNVNISNTIALTSLAFSNLKATVGSFSVTGCTVLPTISIPLLKYAGGFSVSSCAALTTLDSPELEYVNGAWSLGNMTALTTLGMPKLKYVRDGLSTLTVNALTTFSFPALVKVGGSFGPNGMSALTNLNIPLLETVGSSFGPIGLSSLTTLSAPSLTRIGSSFSPSSMAALTTMSFPALISTSAGFTLTTFSNLTSINFSSLATVGTNFTVTGIAVVALSFPALTTTGTFNVSSLTPTTSVSFPSLTSVASLSMTSCPSVTSVNLSALTTCTGAWTFGYAAITNLSLPNLTNITGAVAHTGANTLATLSYSGMITYGSTFAATNISTLTTVTLGTIGTLKSIAGSSVTFSTCALNQASVDGILKLLVSLDGTGGTTLFGGGKSVTLSGGTNAAPSYTGGVPPTRAGSSFNGVGTLCTVTWAGHGYTTGDLLTISGITTLTTANGTFSITVVDPNTFTYTKGSQTAVGAGTATVKKAGAITDGFYAQQVLQVRGAIVTTN